MQMFCKNCGKEVDANAVACMGCGCDPRKGNKFCPNCGAETAAGQIVCVKCGVSLSGKARSMTATTASSGEKNKMVAGLLAIFLGVLGVHKFYLGMTKQGVIMLVAGTVGAFLFCLGPIVMSIIGLIEGIIYMSKSDEDFAQIYVEGKKGWF